MKKTFSTLSAVLLLLSVSATAVRSADKAAPKGDEPRRERMAAMMKDKLGMNDEQFKKLEDAHKKARESIKPLREQLEKAIDKAHGELLIDASDKEIQAALDQVDKARKALASQEEKSRAEIEGMLTPKQRVKMLVFHGRMHRGMMGRGMMGHGMTGRGMMGHGMMGEGPMPCGEDGACGAEHDAWDAHHGMQLPSEQPEPEEESGE